jgi:hypothetical protein
MNVSSNRSVQFAHETGGKTCGNLGGYVGATTLQRGAEAAVSATPAPAGMLRSREGTDHHSKEIGEIRATSFVAASRYLWQVPSNVWQYSPAWQKCQMREFAAWHSHVFTVTSPSPQWANRLNLTAACASCANKQPNAKAKAINRVITSAPRSFPRQRPRRINTD